MSAQIYFLMSSNIFCMFYVVQVMWLTRMYEYITRTIVTICQSTRTDFNYSRALD